MTFEDWFEGEKRADRLYWADEEAARAGWKAHEEHLALELVLIAETALGVRREIAHG